MSYVMGVDLGTGSVKVSVMDREGKIVSQESSSLSLNQAQPGYSEQNPEDWVTATTVAIVNLALKDHIDLNDIEGISYSGQMHGLVLLGSDNQVLRPAILWDDTRTTEQCKEIMDKCGDDFIKITKNRPLEGFTLPKILWVKENEPQIFKQAKTFVLPKDYLRYRMTGDLSMEYSDAAGTVLLDVVKKQWSSEICEKLGLDISICPKLVNSVDEVGTISDKYATFSGMSTKTKVFAGAADNAAGALGAGILDESKVMISTGTSGVVLKYENQTDGYQGQLHFFNHSIPNEYYSMGVTLAAGHSLKWLYQTFGNDKSFDDFVKLAAKAPVGAHGLIFTPYIVGERTPYADSKIRGSFIGVSSINTKADFVRSVMEGVIFSYADILKIYHDHGQHFDTVYSIGGGAKSPVWLQIQANVFNTKVSTLENEQEPGLGAAMIAAVGVKWFSTLSECAEKFVKKGKSYWPEPESADKYQKLYKIYSQVYAQTKEMNHELIDFRNND
ncbi:xylulokinase [Companilactobacillus ginsenosidimutans]|uniref:Xylulose kinase n=1 Tax=Companilactobacillus ginsenosidimutans TaxID=1007676 RepID=A0A0H4QDS6_9LACO|nr:xylulokinase [Companilactobacillus ginsenosidimutans]AKP66479.1 xylulose kinase [Companilactobacillus ginsenosidimutans]